MSSASVLAALAFAESSYAEPIQQKLVKVTRAVKPRHVDSVTTPHTTTAIPSDNGGEKQSVTSVKSAPLPEKGTLDASNFMLALRKAGKRPNDRNIMVTGDAAAIREDEIKAISAFIGYDYQEPHGSQLDAAKRAASVALRPLGAAEFKRGSSASVKGFISGMPDEQRKIIQDLLARERLAVDTMADQNRIAKDLDRVSEERILAQGRVMLEEERLVQIRKDLSALGHQE